MRRRKNSRSKKGKIRNATKCTYKGIKFRSKLELFTYKQLEQAGIKSNYETKRFTLMDGFHFKAESIEPRPKGYIINTMKGRAIKYSPDFIVPNGKWIIEVKGFANDVFPLKWKLFKNYLNQNSVPVPTLYLPKNQTQVKKTIELIKNL